MFILNGFYCLLCWLFFWLRLVKSVKCVYMRTLFLIGSFDFSFLLMICSSKKLKLSVDLWENFNCVFVYSLWGVGFDLRVLEFRRKMQKFKLWNERLDLKCVDKVHILIWNSGDKYSLFLSFLFHFFSKYFFLIEIIFLCNVLTV